MKRIILLSLSSAVAAGILAVNVYNSVVDAANWSALSDSISTARGYFTVANPGTFFRVVSPINQLLSLIVLISLWKVGRLRYIAIALFLIAISADAFTFAYFYPRNEVIFIAPIDNHGEQIRLAIQQWSSMNWVRSLMCAMDTVLCFTALVLTAKSTEQVSSQRSEFVKPLIA